MAASSCFSRDFFANFAHVSSSSVPAGNYIFKVNNTNTSTSCEICSKLKTPKRHQLALFWCFLLLTFNIFDTFFSVSIVTFEQVKASWDSV